MKTAALVVLLVAAFLAGSLYTRSATGRAERPVRYYRDPMHPSYRSDKPGKAPDCGMALEPVYDDEPRPSDGTVRLSSEQLPLAGIVLGRVEKGRVTRSLRALGRVAVDEARIFPVNAGADGIVRQVFPANSDTAVRQGQPLVTVYGREYVTAERAYLYALRAGAAALGVSADTSISLDESRLNLLDMGFGQAQVEQLARERKPLLDVVLAAPTSGTILARSAFPGQRFSRGTELFRIADLSRVWIVAEMIGGDARSVPPGAVARASVPQRPGQVFRATVTEAQPKFDAIASTLQLRLDSANPEGVLRPGMLVDLEFQADVRDAITVPAEAVMDAGLRKTVFVERSPGVFEPRAVETGWREAGRVEVLHGLEPGESIVVSGNFLLDSESHFAHR